jgi:hypothetical protein
MMKSMKETPFADALDHCLDAVISGEKSIDQVVSDYPQFSEELRGELEAALWLDQRRSAVAPRPNFLQSNRNYILDQIRAQSSNPAPQSTASSHWKLVARFAFVFLLAIAMIFSTARIAAASESALPGDRLYPVKLSVENLRLAVTLDVEQEIISRLAYANDRIEEAQTRVDQGQADKLKPALKNYQGHIQQVASLLDDLQNSKPDRARALGAEFEAAKSEHARRLSAMRASVPPDVAGLIDEIEAGLQPEGEEIGAPSSTPTPTVTLTTTPTQTSQPTEEQATPVSQTPPDQSAIEGTPPLVDKDGNPQDDRDGDPDDGDAGVGNDEDNEGNPQDDRDGDPDDGNAGIGDDDGGGNPQDNQDDDIPDDPAPPDDPGLPDDPGPPDDGNPQDGRDGIPDGNAGKGDNKDNKDKNNKNK